MRLPENQLLYRPNTNLMMTIICVSAYMIISQLITDTSVLYNSYQFGTLSQRVKHDHCNFHQVHMQNVSTFQLLCILLEHLVVCYSEMC